jgi:hypothetical protein
MGSRRAVSRRRARQKRNEAIAGKASGKSKSD